MDQIIKHEQCQRCRECCRFRENRQYFAPLFTPEEMQAAREAAPDAGAEFKSAEGGLFQIQLQRAKVNDGIYPYVCPFLDEEAYACSVYDVRPFDCRIWPLIVLRVRETGQVLLAHFTGSVCLAMKEVNADDFEAYKAYFKLYARTEKFAALLRKHPRLIWDHHAEDDYVTVSIVDLTDLFGKSDNSP